MSQDQAYIVYGCGSCGRRIFSERRLLGQTGVCPVCGAQGPVGGALGVVNIGNPSAPAPAPAPAPVQAPAPAPAAPAAPPIAPAAAASPAASAEPKVEPVPVDPGDRRRAPRFKVEHAKLDIENTANRALTGINSDLLHYEIRDLSATGLSFVAQGPKDGRSIRGFRPPEIKVDEQIPITLHLPGTFRPVVVTGRVARIQQNGTKNEFQVGIEFKKLGDDAKVALKKLADRATPS